MKILSSILIAALLPISLAAQCAQNSQVGGSISTSELGVSTAISSDGGTMAMGAPMDNGGAGAVWVFTRSGYIWTQQAKLIWSVPGGGYFMAGQSVALSADGNTLASGSYGAGVMIYSRSGSTWTQQTSSQLVGTNGDQYANQGYSVALSADGNTLVSGGWNDSNITGSIWVFARSGSTWTQQGSKMVGTGSIGNGLFGSAQGYSVAISGDGNTIAEGGPYDNSNTGAVWIYIRSGGSWSQQVKLVGTGVLGSYGAAQGTSVSLSNDGNTLADGGWNDNNFTGATWVFTRSGSSWTQQAKLIGTPNLGNAGSIQGASVSLASDGNTLLIGANGDAQFTGAAWLFVRNSGSWSQSAKYTGFNLSDQFGASMALSGDATTFVVGAPYANSSNGGVWSYSVSPTCVIVSSTMTIVYNVPTSYTVTLSQAATADTTVNLSSADVSVATISPSSILIPLGATQSSTPVTVTGINADGGTTTITASATGFLPGTTALTVVGIPAVSISPAVGVHTGAIAAFSVSIPSPASSSLTISLSSSNTGVAVVPATITIPAGAQAPTAPPTIIGISEGTATITASATNYQTRTGAATVLATATNLYQQQGGKLSDTTGNANQQQGYSTAISADGNTLAVGGPEDNSNAGAVWIYTRSGTVWSQQTKLTASDRVGSAGFGWSVSLSSDGNTLAVGGPQDDSWTGAAWLWTRSGSSWTKIQKFIGVGAIGPAAQGWSVALSGDGGTLAVGASNDNTNIGATFVFGKLSNTWQQQAKLIGSGNVGHALQGWSVALSTDGNTLAVGGEEDNDYTGAVWVFARTYAPGPFPTPMPGPLSPTGPTWTQQGKLIGTVSIGHAYQGHSVSLSGDGNIMVEGGYGDSQYIGAFWTFTRSGSTWTQLNGKTVGNAGGSGQGTSVAISADGTSLIEGAPAYNGTGAIWTFTMSNNLWTQLGSQIVGTGAGGYGESFHGESVAISSDGNTAAEGAPNDIYNTFAPGADWVFIRSSSPPPHMIMPSSMIVPLNSYATVTIVLTSPSPGTVIVLSSSDTGVVTVPSSITAPAGATSVTFQAYGVALGSATISAVSNVYLPASGIATVTYTSGAAYVAVGTNGQLVTSMDNIHWVPVNSSFGSVNINAVTHANGLWVAVGDSGTLATSPDGVNWTQRTSSFDTTNIKTITFSNGVWIAAGTNGKIAISADGMNWTQQTTPF